MSAILRRLRRLEALQTGSERVIVIRSPYALTSDAIDAFLSRQGLARRSSDLVVTLECFPPPVWPFMPELVSVTDAVRSRH